MEYDDEVKITFPYYEMNYLDDNRNLHIAKIKEKSTVDFYKERFEVTNCQVVNS